MQASPALLLKMAAAEADMCGGEGGGGAASAPRASLHHASAPPRGASALQPITPAPETIDGERDGERGGGRRRSWLM